MPRVADPGNEAGREKTARWRENNQARRRPEVDAVDTALAVAVSVYRWEAEKAKSEKAVTRVDALERMAANYLIARGYDAKEADRRVRRRVRRWDVEDLIPLAAGSTGGGNYAPTSDVSITPSSQSR